MKRVITAARSYDTMTESIFTDVIEYITSNKLLGMIPHDPSNKIIRRASGPEFRCEFMLLNPELKDTFRPEVVEVGTNNFERLLEHTGHSLESMTGVCSLERATGSVSRDMEDELKAKFPGKLSIKRRTSGFGNESGHIYLVISVNLE